MKGFMAVALTITPFDYVLKDDRNRPPEEQTVFRLRPLHAKEKQEVERTEWKAAGGEALMVSDRTGLAIRILNCGLLGWSNLRDAEGNEVEFAEVKENNRRILPSHILDRITPWLTELANAVYERTELSEEQKKNSSAP